LEITQVIWLWMFTALWTTAGAELDANQVKARYLVNFMKYVTWPEEGKGSTNAFTIVVQDSANLKNALDEVVRGKEFQGLPIRTVHTMTTHEFANARMIFTRETNREKVTALLAETPKRTLTIGEGPSFLAHGGMIEFNIFEGKVRFNVNLPALRQAGFSVDPKLLVAAQEVRK
jgi:hypothetical protein